MAPQPWKPERRVPPGLARKLLENQFPELTPLKLVSLGKGWDNAAYFVNETWVFRFPQRKSAVKLIVTESRVLPRIAAQLPLPIPVPELIGTPSDDYPWPFAGHRYLWGRTACVAEASAACRLRSAPELGGFLRTLHGIPTDTATARHAERDGLGRLDPKGKGDGVMERLSALKGKGFVDDLAPWAAIVERACSVELQPKECLVHGDLYARHLLLNESEELSGVIDWGDVHRGHPAVDLAIAWSFLPADARPAFRRAYGPIDESGWIMARYRALHTASHLILYGLDTSDQSLVTEGRKALEHISSA